MGTSSLSFNYHASYKPVWDSYCSITSILACVESIPERTEELFRILPGRARTLAAQATFIPNIRSCIVSNYIVQTSRTT